MAPLLWRPPPPGGRANEKPPHPQDDSQSDYVGQVKKSDGEINWQLPAEDIWRRVRAYYPWPGCYTHWKGRQLKISEAAVMPGGRGRECGAVIALPENEGAVGIVTGEGILKVLNIQYAGKKTMTAAAFSRGQRDFIGARLPS